jgi:hypothetical protein
MDKAVIHTALIALAAYVAVAVIQDKVFKIPVVGDYLPGA